MEINPIYTRYRSGSVSFETTLRLLQDLISERLNSDYRRVFVQASNSSRVNFCFTVFFTRDRYNDIGGFYYDYEIRTQEVRNFRNWRPDGDLEQEVRLIENLIESFRTNSLSEVFS